jgi:hypothetical protein
LGDFRTLYTPETDSTMSEEICHTSFSGFFPKTGHAFPDGSRYTGKRAAGQGN